MDFVAVGFGSFLWKSFLVDHLILSFFWGKNCSRRWDAVWSIRDRNSSVAVDSRRWVFEENAR